MPNLNEARNLTAYPDPLTPSDKYKQMMRRQEPYATVYSISDRQEVANHFNGGSDA